MLALRSVVYVTDFKSHVTCLLGPSNVITLYIIHDRLVSDLCNISASRRPEYIFSV